jgi:hypothetical protein
MIQRTMSLLRLFSSAMQGSTTHLKSQFKWQLNASAAAHGVGAVSLSVSREFNDFGISIVVSPKRRVFFQPRNEVSFAAAARIATEYLLMSPHWPLVTSDYFSPCYFACSAQHPCQMPS